MADCVELPDGDLIDYLEFARALARAESPVVASGATGMACITGKLVRYLPPRSDQDSLQSHQPQSESSNADDPGALELQLPYKLSVDDSRKLAKLLRSLPQLCHPISTDRRSEFMEAYRKEAKTDWEPILLTERDIEKQRQRQDHFYVKFLRALEHEFLNGRLTACDAHRIPTRALGRGSFVPRQSALDYLQRFDFMHCGVAVVAAPDSSPATDSADAYSYPPNQITSAELGGAKRASPADTGRRPSWTVQQYQALADFHGQRKAAGKRPLLDCAEKFKIHKRTVSKKLKEWDEHPSNPQRVMFALAGR